MNTATVSDVGGNFRDYIKESTEHPVIIDEASAGDEDAAKARLAALSQVILLDATDEALLLARKFIQAGAIPEKAAEDAVHIAIAVTNGVEYLVTWNCRHIANAIMRPHIEAVCLDVGYEPTIICTPEELMEPDYENYDD
ncbi:MAG: type II toxin-antitoxin system VapC family toxin [Desulfobacterales bacterium]|nr:type II toxin-antitoxin system VapC family toxin [Desulfobacterales bacterium]